MYGGVPEATVRAAEQNFNNTISSLPAAGTIKSSVDSITSVIETLKICYNSDKGIEVHSKLKSMCESDLDFKAIETALEELKNVKVDVSTSHSVS